MIVTLIETCKLGAIDPQGYLAHTINQIVQRYPQSRIDELRPWAYPGVVNPVI